jgi:hypothetical protein
MQLYKSDRQRYMAGLLYIFLIYTISYLIFAEHCLIGKFKIPELLNHVFMFVMAVLVYMIGTMHLGKLQEPWMFFIWNITYIILLSIFLILILVKLLLFTISYTIRSIYIFDHITFILISPMLYFSLGLLNRLLIKEPQPV